MLCHGTSSNMIGGGSTGTKPAKKEIVDYILPQTLNKQGILNSILLYRKRSRICYKKTQAVLVHRVHSDDALGPDNHLQVCEI